MTSQKSFLSALSFTTVHFGRLEDSDCFGKPLDFKGHSRLHWSLGSNWFWPSYNHGSLITTQQQRSSWHNDSPILWYSLRLSSFGIESSFFIGHVISSSSLFLHKTCTLIHMASMWAVVHWFLNGTRGFLFTPAFNRQPSLSPVGIEGFGFGSFWYSGLRMESQGKRIWRLRLLDGHAMLEDSKQGWHTAIRFPYLANEVAT